jgi:3-hydroxybutyryl-CoA dehydratase
MSADHSGPPPVVHELSQRVVDLYAQISGDFNPIHVDPAYAARTPLGGTVAHGPLVLQAFFDALLTWLDVEALPAGVRLQAVFRAPTPSKASVSCHLLRIDLEDDIATVRAECRTGETIVVSAAATIPAPSGSPARAALLAARAP